MIAGMKMEHYRHLAGGTWTVRDMIGGSMADWLGQPALDTPSSGLLEP
jgi:hypothetical protein